MRRRVLVLIAILLSTSGLVPIIPVNGANVTITVNIASTGFSPVTFTVNKGDMVSLTVKNVDALGGNNHGFELKDPDGVVRFDLLKVSGYSNGLPEGASYTFTFTADKAGTWTFRCNLGCSGHSKLQNGAMTVNNPPVLGPVSSKTVNEATLLTFTVIGTDPDAGQTMTLTATGLPSGATFTSTPAGGTVSGTFNWTPTEAHGPGVYTVNFTVTDSVSPPGSDSKLVSITVSEVNSLPVVAVPAAQTVNEGVLLTFPVSASDPDLPKNTLTLSASGLPSGASFPTVTGSGTTTGTFSWTPSPGQASATPYVISFTATDNGTPTLSDTKTVSITVLKSGGTPPTLTPIGNKSVDEENLLTFTVTASDSDATQTLTLTATGLPSGTSFTSTPAKGTVSGTFSWTPTEAQGPNTYKVTFTLTDSFTPPTSVSETITITVREVNQTPVLTLSPSQSIDEASPLSFTVTATDADLDSAGQALNILTITATGLPPGATFPPTLGKEAISGSFDWTPGEDQAPQIISVSFTVTDDGSPLLSETKPVSITVREVNTPPVVAVPASQTVSPGTTLTFTVNATDADLDSSGLPLNTISLTATGLPTEASFTSTPGTGRVAGTLSFTPGENQGGLEFTVTFTAMDNGDPALSDQKTVTLTVVEVPPVHDIAVVSVSSSPSDIPSGVTVMIRVLVKNQGTVSESFNVTLSYDEKIVESRMITSLGPGSYLNASFDWNTAGLSPARYNLAIVLDILSQETSTLDNAASVVVDVIGSSSLSDSPLSLIPSLNPYLIGAFAAGIMGLLGYILKTKRRNVSFQGQHDPWSKPST